MKRLAAVAAFLMALCSNVGATTYYVSKTGADAHACSGTDSAGTNKLTIAAGLTCIASPGDVLRVHTGTYSEYLTIGTAGINVPSGTLGSRITIEGYPGDIVGMLGWNIYSRSYITVRNFVCTGNVNRIGRASTADAASVFIVFDSIEARGWSPGASSTGGAGIMAGFRQESVSSNITILNCLSHDNGGNKFDHGVYVTARDVTITGGSFYSNTGHGIHVYSGTQGATNNATVSGVRAYSNGSYGIGLMAGSNLLAYNNIVYSNGSLVAGSGGMSLRLGGVGAIYNNTVYSNTGYGIRSEDSASNVIRNNALLSNTGVAVSTTGNPIQSNNVTNPTFVDTTDFQLAAGSTALDAGACLESFFSTDFSGVTRSSGSCTVFGEGLAWDAGAQEKLDSAGDSLTLLSPDSGTLGETGSTQVFTWGATGTIANVKLEYDAANDGVFEGSLTASTPNDGTQSFTAPAAGTTYRFRVCDTDGSPCSVSASNVTITASAGGTFTKIISENTTGSKTGDFSGVDDNSITKSTPTLNRGTENPLGVYKYSASAHSHSLLTFSGLSQIPPTAVLTSVTLGLFVQGGLGGTAQTFDVRQVLRTWGEISSTWNKYDATNNWTTAGALGAATDRVSTALAQITSIDLTAQYRTVTQTSGSLFDLVQNWIDGDTTNQGLHIERNGSGEDTTFRDITSGEGTDGQRPYLEVTYTYTAPSIQVVEPTAISRFYPGSVENTLMPIRWDSAGLSGNFKVEISYDGGTSYATPAIVASHPFNQADAVWTVAGRGCTACIVQVCSLVDPTVCGRSQPFKISSRKLKGFTP